MFAALEARFEVFWPVIMGWGSCSSMLSESGRFTRSAFDVEADTSPFPPADGSERPVKRDHDRRYKSPTKRGVSLPS